MNTFHSKSYYRQQQCVRIDALFWNACSAGVHCRCEHGEKKRDVRPFSLSQSHLIKYAPTCAASCFLSSEMEM